VKENYYVNGELKAENSTPGTSSYQNEISFGGVLDSTTYWDNIRIRKYVYPEPTVLVFDEEDIHSVIKNNGSLNISGYLLMQILNRTTGEVISTQVNDSETQTKRTVNHGCYLNLSGVWNSNPWNTDNEQDGWYRVFVALTDQQGNILRNDSGDNISGYYDFYADTIPPKWNNLGVNESYPKKGWDVGFSAKWNDNYGLESWIFSWNLTPSGEWENISSGNFSELINWSNTTNNIPSFGDSVYGYRFYVFDEAGNINSTDVYIFSISGYPEVQLIQPVDLQIVARNVTFLVNTTVVCKDGTCGNISGRVRYNATSEHPDTDIPTSSTEPLYIVNGNNPENCQGNPMVNNEYCELNWNVNVTGEAGKAYKIGVLFESSQPNVDSNHTDNHTIQIVSCILDITLQWDNISFGGIEPGKRKNASGNMEDEYNITVESTTTCNVDLYIRGDDLERVAGEYTIGAGNISWSNVSNDYATSHKMNHTWALINESVSPGTNTTTYYWMNAPYAVADGLYNGSIYIEGVERGETP